MRGLRPPGVRPTSRRGPRTDSIALDQRAVRSASTTPRESICRTTSDRVGLVCASSMPPITGALDRAVDDPCTSIDLDAAGRLRRRETGHQTQGAEEDEERKEHRRGTMVSDWTLLLKTVR